MQNKSFKVYKNFLYLQIGFKMKFIFLLKNNFLFWNLWKAGCFLPDASFYHINIGWSLVSGHNLCVGLIYFHIWHSRQYYFLYSLNDAAETLELWVRNGSGVYKCLCNIPCADDGPYYETRCHIIVYCFLFARLLWKFIIVFTQLFKEITSAFTWLLRGT